MNLKRYMKEEEIKKYRELKGEEYHNFKLKIKILYQITFLMHIYDVGFVYYVP